MNKFNVLFVVCDIGIVAYKLSMGTFVHCIHIAHPFTTLVFLANGSVKFLLALLPASLAAMTYCLVVVVLMQDFSV